MSLQIIAGAMGLVLSSFQKFAYSPPFNICMNCKGSEGKKCTERKLEPIDNNRIKGPEKKLLRIPYKQCTDKAYQNTDQKKPLPVISKNSRF